MSRPETFQERYVTLHTAPYICGDGSSEPAALSGGVLKRGEIVWTKTNLEPNRQLRSTPAFVDGVGIITLDAKRLVRADALQPVSQERL